MRPIRGFASDNAASVHPTMLNAIIEANVGHAPAYGDDRITARATAALQRLFGEDTRVAFVFGGTGANVVGLAALAEPFHAIICAETAHIHAHECGAPERFIGSKLLPVPTPDGKLRPADIGRLLEHTGDPHHVQPKVVSVSQPTERGTVYTMRELCDLATFAHANGLAVHLDGARFANAVAALGGDACAETRKAGVDVLSLGGTKNGMLYGEAVICFSPTIADRIPFLRKQATQLPSKMRFIAAQFEALLTDDLWLRNAQHANTMAQRLAEHVADIPGVRITQPVETNAVFAIIPKPCIERLQATYPFYVWNDALGEVRWMTAFDTTPTDVDQFTKTIRTQLNIWRESEGA